MHTAALQEKMENDVRSSAYTFPPLTTYNVPKFRMGEMAVTILNNLVCADDPIPPARTVMLGHMVVRESTAPPRTAP